MSVLQELGERLQHLAPGTYYADIFSRPVQFVRHPVLELNRVIVALILQPQSVFLKSRCCPLYIGLFHLEGIGKFLRLHKHFYRCSCLLLRQLLLVVSINGDRNGNRQRTHGVLCEPAQYTPDKLKKGSVKRRVPPMELFVLFFKPGVGRMDVDCERQIFNGPVDILSIIA